jgi:hypothetical protein
MGDVGEAAVEVDRAFRWWRDQIAGLQVAGREELVNFQPAWAPQYDDRKFNLDRPTYVPAQSKDQVIEMATVARKHAEPVGHSGVTKEFKMPMPGGGFGCVPSSTRFLLAILSVIVVSRAGRV